MAATRVYDFTTGIETGSAPAAGTPSAADDVVTLSYLQSYVAANAGGGGSSVNFIPKEGAGPLVEYEYNAEVMKFPQDDTIVAVGFFLVPATYQSGNPISINLVVYTPSTSGNIKMKATTYLLEDGAGQVDSTGTFHASTNTEITVTATARRVHKIEIDLTEPDGQINGTNVAAGDTLRVQLYRDYSNETSSVADDVRLIKGASEVTIT